MGAQGNSFPGKRICVEVRIGGPCLEEPFPIDFLESSYTSFREESRGVNVAGLHLVISSVSPLEGARSARSAAHVFARIVVQGGCSLTHTLKPNQIYITPIEISGFATCWR